jgi:hypothetical protein
MRKITWRCTAQTSWQWLSGSPGNPGFSVANDGTREGTITLPPNKDYWYSCVELVLQGVGQGNAYLRYFNEGGVDKIQAITVAQGKWQVDGPIDTQSSQTNSSGGINLIASFV